MYCISITTSMSSGNSTVGDSGILLIDNIASQKKQYNNHRKPVCSEASAAMVRNAVVGSI